MRVSGRLFLVVPDGFALPREAASAGSVAEVGAAAVRAVRRQVGQRRVTARPSARAERRQIGVVRRRPRLPAPAHNESCARRLTAASRRQRAAKPALRALARAAERAQRRPPVPHVVPARRRWA